MATKYLTTFVSILSLLHSAELICMIAPISLLTYLYLSLELHMDQLISLILKVAKEQAYCFPNNKVMIFTVENEGQANETAAFRMIDIDDD